MNPRIEQPNAEGAEVAQKTQKDSHQENDFTREIIGAAVEVQRELGVGMLESAYIAALKLELAARGLPFRAEVPIAAFYKGQPLGVGYRADLIVAGSVIVEVKACEDVVPAHRAQLLSYLRLANVRLGLLINFNAFPVVKAVHRVVNQL